MTYDGEGETIYYAISSSKTWKWKVRGSLDFGRGEERGESDFARETKASYNITWGWTRPSRLL